MIVHFSEHVIDVDSYVYLAAVRTMVELAKWRSHYLDEMLDILVRYKKFVKDPVVINGMLRFATVIVQCRCVIRYCCAI